jgi:hypothetical protein
MKNLLFTLITLITVSTYAQVGIGTTSPNASSILELNSTTQGMLTPRMTESERDLIATPATGLLIYQINNTPGFYYYNSTAWVPFGGGGAEDHDWYQITSDDTPDHINDDIYTHGNVAVGNNAPTAKLHVTGVASGGSAGTATILSQDFESSTLGFVTGTGSTNEYHTTAPGGTEVWRVVDASTDYVTIKCASCTGQWIEMEYESVDQDETFVSSQFSPSATATSLDITFDYIYKEFLGSADESFSAYLYNDSDGAIASTLFSHNDVGDQDLSYSGSFTFSGANVATDNYTLRFQYTGNGDYGASVDNLVVIENAVAAPGSSVFRLEDGTQQNGYVLTSDANGNATWQVAGAGGTDSQILSISGSDLTISNGNTVTLPGGGGSYTFDNGLTLTGSNAQLGGTLIKNTTINLDDNDLTFSSSKTVAFPGEITFEGTDRDMMITNFDQNYVAFGSSSFLSTTTFDGTTITDSGNQDFTVDVSLGVYNGSSGGSSLKMGSIEYIVDGLGELFVNTDLSSVNNNSDNSGTSTHKWNAVYAFNGTIQTSDLRLKKNIKNLSYGLDEILKLETLTYDWKESKRGKSFIIPDQYKERKIGFSAQQLLTVLPESVQTHSWVAADEEGNYKRIENEHLGVYYSAIIPVTVKAIQEQQEQIEELKTEVSDLKELINKLISEKK